MKRRRRSKRFVGVPKRSYTAAFEPPGSTHTLRVADRNTGDTDVVFIVYGAMIHLGPNGEVLAIGDAESHLRDWHGAARAGQTRAEDAAIGGAMRYRPVHG